MFGAFFGFIISLIVIMASGTVSWWWLLWGSLIGLVVEILIRLGGGDGFGEAVGSAIDIIDFASSGDGGGGDCGGGDSGGGDGGGGD